MSTNKDLRTQIQSLQHRLTSEQHQLQVVTRDSDRRQYELRTEIHDLMLKARPTFPTSWQKMGMLQALAVIRDGTPAASHHGDGVAPPPAPGSVRVRGDIGWLHIEHLSPYSPKTRELAWHFTPEEVTEILDFLDQHGLAVIRHWRSERGLSVEGKIR